MRCINCQNELKPGTRFCTRCGTPVPVEEAVPQSQIPVQAAVEYHRQTLDVPAPKPAPPRKSGKHVFMNVVSIFLCIILFFTLAVGITGLQLRQMLTADAIADMVEEIDVAELKAEDFVEDADDDETLIEYICREVVSQSSASVKISERDVKKFIEKSTILEFVTEKLEDYLNDAFNGTNTASITERELRKLLEGNAELMDKMLGLKVPNVYEAAETIMGYGVEDLDSDYLRKEMGPVYTAVSVGLSYWLSIGLLVFSLLLAVAIFALSRWQIGTGLVKVGVPVLVLGVLMCLGSLLIQVIVEAILGSGVAQIVSVVLGGNLTYSLILLGLGIALLAAGIIIRMVQKKKTA